MTQTFTQLPIVNIFSQLLSFCIRPLKIESRFWFRSRVQILEISGKTHTKILPKSKQIQAEIGEPIVNVDILVDIESFEKSLCT